MTGRPTRRTGTVRLDKDHVLLPQGTIYCRECGDQEAPTVTHSRVKCSLCGRTLQTSTNPKKVSHADFKERLLGASDRVKALSFLMKYPGWQSFDPSAYKAAEALEAQGLVEIARHKAPATWQVRALPRNPVPRRLQVYAKRAAKFAAGRAGRFLSAYAKKNPNIIDAIQHGDRVTIVDRFGQERTGKAVMRSGDGLGWMLNMGGAHGTPALAYEGNITKVSKGRDTRNGGLRSRLFGNPPSGRGPVKIYGETQKIFMRKTSGPYKGQRFVHDFKKGVQQIGFPRGTVVKFPDGRMARITTRSVMLTGKKDLYRHFAA